MNEAYGTPVSQAGPPPTEIPVVTDEVHRKLARDAQDAPPPSPAEAQSVKRWERAGKDCKKRTSLRGQLPDGVYDARPLMKRYVLHWMYFWLYARLHLYVINWMPLPRPTYAEQIIRDVAKLRVERKKLHIIDITAGEKGSVGKTTNTVASAAQEASATQGSCLVFDNNQTRGTTASACGVTETLTTRQLITINETTPELLTADWLTTHLGEHPIYGNLFVIDSDDAEARRRYPVIAEERMIRLIEALSKCFARVSIDQGNNPEMPAQVAAVKCAKVLRFVVDPSVDQAIKRCIETMDYYRLIVPEKVANCVLIISAHRKGYPDAAYYASLFNLPVDQVVLMPFERGLMPPKTRRSNQQFNTAEERLAELARLTRPIVLHRYNKKYIDALNKLELQARRMAWKNVNEGHVSPITGVPVAVRRGIVTGNSAVEPEKAPTTKSLIQSATINGSHANS